MSFAEILAWTFVVAVGGGLLVSFLASIVDQTVEDTFRRRK